MEKRLHFLIDIVRTSAHQIKKLIPSSGLVLKNGQENFLTDADLTSQKIIMEAINRQFPNEDIVSEEKKSEYTATHLLSTDHLWVIDPIDGTNNFKNERNYSSISIGYVEKGIIKIGVVYNFYSDELFYAQSGKGSFLNNKPISVNSLTDISKGIVATETYYTSDVIRQNLELFLRIKPTPFILIRGCASLVMCEIACGRTDLYFHSALKPWDNAAAFLIVLEAGGIVKGLDGKEISFLSPSAVVGNDKLVEQFITIIK